MALFQKKSQMEKFEAVTLALRKRGELLGVKRAAAQAAFDSAVAARQHMLISGDLDDEKLASKMQGAVDSSASTLSGIIDASTALSSQMITAEQQLGEATLANARKVASETLATQIATIDRLLPGWLASSRDLAGSMEAIAWRFETAQQGIYIRNAAAEIEAASAFTSADLHASVAQVLAGQLDQAIPPDRVETVPVTEPEPEALTQVFNLHAIQWRDASGKLHRSAKWTDVELPEKAAAFALRSGLAVPLDDPRCAKFRGQSPGHPSPHWCNNLDDGVGPDILLQPQAACRVRSNESDARGGCLRCGSEVGQPCPMPLNEHEPAASQFTPLDRGGPFQLKIAAG
jgi:hypothetical protein